MRKTVFTNLLSGLLAVGFFLGIHNGRIGIWLNGEKEPSRVIPCPVFLLTPSQQKALTQGIQIDTMEDMESLIRNFFP